jgi:anti-sigma regulatory factor (Ser/Thr protein kinase)
MQSLTLQATLEALSPIAEYVKAAATEAGLGKKAVYNLRLAVDEIATNIITHGYKEANLEGAINLTATLDEQSLTIVVEDTGVAYDPRQALSREEATLDDPLEDRPIGGLGIYLAIEGVDQFHYERVGNRNRNVFVMNRS